MSFSPESEIKDLTINPWQKIVAFEKILGQDQRIIYNRRGVKDLTRAGSSIMFRTFFCIPANQMVRDGKLVKKPKDPYREVESYTIEWRAASLAYLLRAVPGSQLTVTLADDDWAYIPDNQPYYKPQVVEYHRQELALKLRRRFYCYLDDAELEKGRVVINTTTDLVRATSFDFPGVKSTVLGRVMAVAAKPNFEKLLPQQSGWIKAIIRSALEKARERQGQLDISPKEALLKAIELQAGIVVEGILLRQLCAGKPTIYLGTFHELSDFWGEMAMMMKVDKDLANFSKSIPAIYCPTGKLDYSQVDERAREIL